MESIKGRRHLSQLSFLDLYHKTQVLSKIPLTGRHPSKMFEKIPLSCIAPRKHELQFKNEP